MDATLELFRLRLPLRSAYHLSFSTVEQFESLVVVLTSGSHSYWGEATALPGYSPETIDSMWDNARAWVYAARGDIGRLRESAESACEVSSFAATPLLVAIEKMATEWLPGAAEVPLVGTVNGSDPATIARSVKSLLDSGYTTLKLKVFGSPESDRERVQAVHQVSQGRGRIRIDANEAFTRDDARTFLTGLDQDDIELVEQPLARQDWEGVARLVRTSPVPIMLDESIWTEKDVVQASSMPGVTHIKLKLVKHGSMARTRRLARLAHDSGLKVVLGNGVQTDLGCYDEAFLYHEARISLAGDLNGFLKVETALTLPSPLESHGRGYFSAGPTMDQDALTHCAVDHVQTEFSLGVPLNFE